MLQNNVSVAFSPSERFDNGSLSKYTPLLFSGWAVDVPSPACCLHTWLLNSRSWRNSIEHNAHVWLNLIREHIIKGYHLPRLFCRNQGNCEHVPSIWVWLIGGLVLWFIWLRYFVFVVTIAIMFNAKQIGQRTPVVWCNDV